MARTMTPSGTPRPMPTLVEAPRLPGRGVDEVGCIVGKTGVGEVCKGEGGRDEEVDVREDVDMREVDMRGEVDMREDVDTGKTIPTGSRVFGEVDTGKPD